MATVEEMYYTKHRRNRWKFSQAPMNAVGLWDKTLGNRERPAKAKSARGDLESRR